MPIVPTTPGLPPSGESQSPLRDSPAQPSQSALLMATSSMNSLGRIKQAAATTIPWEKLSSNEQEHLTKDAVKLKEGTPELDKFDEALYAHGSIRLPAGKGKDDPRKYLEAPHNELPSNVMRYNLPDGSVILKMNRKQPLTS